MNKAQVKRGQPLWHAQKGTMTTPQGTCGRVATSAGTKHWTTMMKNKALGKGIGRRGRERGKLTKQQRQQQRRESDEAGSVGRCSSGVTIEGAN